MGTRELSARLNRRSVEFDVLVLLFLLLQGALVILAGTNTARATQVYKWVDEQGVTHFSETPPEGTRKAEVLNIEGRGPVTALPRPRPPPARVLIHHQGQGPYARRHWESSPA